MAELNFSIEKTYWKEEVPVDITPTTDPQTVTPEAGQAFNKVNVGAIPYPVLQDKEITPTKQTQNVTYDDGYDGLREVEVKPIPSQYIVPAGTKNITTNGDHDVTDKATAHVSVQPVLETATVTPTEQKQTVEPGQGKDGLSAVTVNPIPPQYVVPSGSVNITENGTDIDVAGKATANVNVPQGVFPSGTKVITENVTGEDVTNYAAVDVAVPGPSGTKQISITENGTTTEDMSEYADAEITVNVPAGVMPSEFFPLQKTTVTAGANAVATIGDYIRFVIGLIPANMDIIAISMVERKQSYDAGEVLLCRLFW